MWLPETAVDDRTLAVLAEEGVRFTILAPGQIAAVRRLDGDGEGAWRTPGVDEGVALPGTARWRHPDDPARGVDLVIYDGPISHDVAFGGFPSQVVVERIVGRAGGELVAVACDGETFGHHHHYADRGVAYALTVEADRRGVALPRLADWLAEHPPTHEARVRVSAWSCVHGVGRWMEDCGCHTGGEPGWNQAWRSPLRAAFDRMRDAAVEVFERRGPVVLHDPWAARDAYVEVLLGVTSIERFAGRARARRRRAPGGGADPAREPAPRAADVHVVRVVLQRPRRPRDRADHALRGLLRRPAGRAGGVAAGRRRRWRSWPRRRATIPTRATGGMYGAGTSTRAGSIPPGWSPTWR